MQRSIDRYDEGVASGEVHKIDQLAAMRLAEEAWNYEHEDTLANCFRKTGILPGQDAVQADPCRSELAELQ